MRPLPIIYCFEGPNCDIPGCYSEADIWFSEENEGVAIATYLKITPESGRAAVDLLEDYRSQTEQVLDDDLSDATVTVKATNLAAILSVHDALSSGPLENSLSMDELRREVRELWNRETAFTRDLMAMPILPPVATMRLLSSAARIFPDAWERGKELQRDHREVPPKTEYECGAGLWSIIRPALAAAAREDGDVKQAPAESPQSGGEAVTPNLNSPSQRSE